VQFIYSVCHKYSTWISQKKRKTGKKNSQTFTRITSVQSTNLQESLFKYTCVINYPIN